MAKELDNIEMDMIEAERLGYGVQYGRYKMDHPFTKEANEERRKKMAKSKHFRKEVFICPVCGKEFPPLHKNQKYCSYPCRYKRNQNAKKPKKGKQ